MSIASQHNLDNERDEFARFIEQTTFGATWQDIQGIMAIGGEDNNNNLVTTARTKIALWVQQQQNASLTAPTYHPEFLRSCAYARFKSSSTYGHVTHPSQANTLYGKLCLYLQTQSEICGLLCGMSN
jgi:hypothetical protein